MRPERLQSCVDIESEPARRAGRLRQFRLTFRKPISAVMAASSAVEDLADSFPALLFALSTGYGSADQRQAAIRLIVSGAQLKEVAAALDLPFWLRRLPASALTQALPAMPSDPDFAAMVANRMPATSKDCGSWFDRLLLTYKLIGRDFALWAIREPRFQPLVSNEDDLQWMFAWAWASTRKTSRGYALIRVPWTPAMTWKRAREEISLWRKRIDLISALAGPPRDPWFADGSLQGHEFIGLATVDAFIAESAIMENCLDQYAAHLAYGRVRVFSVRRNGRPIANVELSLRSDDASMPCISQIRGLRNRRASPMVWQAVHAWLGSQPFRALSAAPTSNIASRDALRDFWRPYVESVQSAGLPPRLLTTVLGRPRKRGDALMRVLQDLGAAERTRQHRVLANDVAGLMPALTPLNRT